MDNTEEIYLQHYQTLQEILEQNEAFTNVKDLKKIVMQLLKYLQSFNIDNLSISETEDCEILLYSSHFETSRNLIIDNDGNITFFYLDKQDVNGCYQQNFYQTEGYNLLNVANLLTYNGV